jgi:hypothetical protein
MNKEDKQAIVDAKWWRYIAEAVDCSVIGFTYREYATFRHLDTHQTVEVPGFLAQRILEMYDDQEGG